MAVRDPFRLSPVYYWQPPVQLILECSSINRVVDMPGGKMRPFTEINTVGTLRLVSIYR